MAKFEAMATKIWICWHLEEFIAGEVRPPMEYITHQLDRKSEILSYMYSNYSNCHFVRYSNRRASLFDTPAMRFATSVPAGQIMK